MSDAPELDDFEQPSQSQMQMPELIIGLVAPIGSDLPTIIEEANNALTFLNYDCIDIRLTEEMLIFKKAGYPDTDSGDLYQQYTNKMNYAQRVREDLGTPDAMAQIAIKTIREHRKSRSGDVKKTLGKTAYIIRQLKLPEEVSLLRRVYGRQFVLISGSAPTKTRRARLFEEVKKTVPTDTADNDIWHQADKLIERDSSESDSFGQNVVETFHLGDVIVDASEKETIRRTLTRFFNAFFGKNDITPSISEYGMYLAKTASIRSSDLSRQVGAAIIQNESDIVADGCNEVAKAGGGNYWDGDDPDFRDVKRGFDPNEELKNDVLKNIIERLYKHRYLSSEKLKDMSTDQIFEMLTDPNSEDGILSDSKVMELTEFGRVVHAEMNAICSAARIGRSIKGGTLYCTTFPCHNCTKHIIASGIRRVVYMEPYPKSKTRTLFHNEIEIESSLSDNKIHFIPFSGISPFRYRDIFEKGKRKKDGKAMNWYKDNKPAPMLNVEFPSYPQTEIWAMKDLIGNIRNPKRMDAKKTPPAQ